MTSIAFDRIDGIGTYRVIFDHLEKHFILTEQKTKKEVEKIDSELIKCNIHRKIRKAFICQHINAAIKLGYKLL